MGARSVGLSALICACGNPDTTDDAAVPVDCGAPVFPEAGMVPRWPYLQDVRADAATIAWGLAPGSTSKLRWGTDPDALTEASATSADLSGPTEPMTLSHVRLTGLTPASTYCYALEVDGKTVASGLSFRTAPKDDRGQVTFVVIGDYGRASSDQFAVRDAIAAIDDHVDFWLTTGDNAYSDGTHDELQLKVFQVYQRQWSLVPVFPTPGNHDYGTGTLTPYRDNFFLPEVANVRDVQEAYYSFDWGPVHIAALDSDQSMLHLSSEPDDDQMDFARADLSATTRPWKIAAWHHPPYSGQPDRTAELPSWLVLRPMVEELGVDLVLTGHNHMYERFSHIRDDAKVDEGTTYIVTGGAGASLYDIGPHPLQDVAKRAFHFLKVTADACTLTGTAIDVTGTEIDRFVLERCE